MRRIQIYFIASILLLIIILFGFQYLVSIYEVQINITPENLYADNKSECTIEAVPLNSIGIRAFFRNASARIEIKEGNELIDVIQIDESRGLIRIRAKDKPGTVVIFIKPDKALLPTSVEIKILPDLV